MKKLLFSFIFLFLFLSAYDASADVVWLDPAELSVGLADSWTDMDVSASVPSGATGVILHYVNNSGYSNAVGFRKNGSTDDRKGAITAYQHGWATIGIDANRVFEAYSDNLTYIDVYLAGYFMSEAVFFTNAVDKSIDSTGSYADIDISSDTGTDTAIGALFEVPYGVFSQRYSLRNNGSTDDIYQYVTATYHAWQAVGVDSSEILEGKISDTGIDFFLVGYMTSGAVFYTNAIDLSLGSTGEWTDLAQLPSGANGGFFKVAANLATDDYGLRKNGSAEDIYYRPCSYQNGAFVECDASCKIEGKIESTNMDFWLMGYTTSGTITVNSSQTGKITDGLVLMQSFDGADMDWSASSAEAVDATANNNDGDVSGATAAIGKIGQALDFDGTDDYVSQGDVSSGVKTIAFWINADDLTTRKIIDIDGTDQIELDGSSDILATSFPGATNIYIDGIVASTLTAGWHHVIITDATGVNASAMDIGRVGGSYFDGKLDEIRLYTRVISTDEIGDLYRMGSATHNSSQTGKITDGLIHMQSFDGPHMDWSQASAEAQDQSVNNNDGDVIGGANVVPGKIGQALNLDGSDDYVHVEGSIGAENQGELTSSFWIRQADSSGPEGVMSVKSDGGGVVFGWLYRITELYAFYVRNESGTTVSVDSDSAINDGEWHHLAGVYNGSNVLMYVDGAIQADQGELTGLTETQTNYNFDIGDVYTNRFQGMIDEVRVYNRALSEDEVGDLYRMGSATHKQ